MKYLFLILFLLTCKTEIRLDEKPTKEISQKEGHLKLSVDQFLLISNLQGAEFYEYSSKTKKTIKLIPFVDKVEVLNYKEISEEKFYSLTEVKILSQNTEGFVIPDDLISEKNFIQQKIAINHLKENFYKKTNPDLDPKELKLMDKTFVSSFSIFTFDAMINDQNCMNHLPAYCLNIIFDSENNIIHADFLSNKLNETYGKIELIDKEIVRLGYSGVMQYDNCEKEELIQAQLVLNLKTKEIYKRKFNEIYKCNIKCDSDNQCHSEENFKTISSKKNYTNSKGIKIQPTSKIESFFQKKLSTYD